MKEESQAVRLGVVKDLTFLFLFNPESQGKYYISISNNHTDNKKPASHDTKRAF